VAASRGRRRSCHRIRPKSPNYEGMEPFASCSDNDHLIPPSFVSMRRCDSDSTLEPCVHVFLKVALVMFVCCRRLFFISIDLFFFVYTVLLATVQCVCGAVGFWSYSIFFKSQFYLKYTPFTSSSFNSKMNLSY
jgi:hypothetical protein